MDSDWYEWKYFTCETHIVILVSSINDFEFDNIKIFPNLQKHLTINCENKNWKHSNYEFILKLLKLLNLKILKIIF